jgi:hypothetical protein
VCTCTPQSCRSPTSCCTAMANGQCVSGQSDTVCGGHGNQCYNCRLTMQFCVGPNIFSQTPYCNPFP